MIDFHSHILPRIDDGSRSSDESLELLRIEKLDGVDEIVFTPHFYAEKDSPKHFLDRRQGSYERLLQRVEDSSLAGAGLKFHLGAEICYFTGMGRADVLKDLSIDGTGTALIEMPFAQWNDQVVRDIEELIQKQGLNVILAHIERYEPYQKNRTCWDRIFEMPVIPQMNTGPFLQGFLKSRKAYRILEEQAPVILGTDAHNTGGRKPNLAAGRRAIQNKLGRETLHQIDELSQTVIRRIRNEEN